MLIIHFDDRHNTSNNNNNNFNNNNIQLIAFKKQKSKKQKFYWFRVGNAVHSSTLLLRHSLYSLHILPSLYVSVSARRAKKSLGLTRNISLKAHHRQMDKRQTDRQKIYNICRERILGSSSTCHTHRPPVVYGEKCVSEYVHKCSCTPLCSQFPKPRILTLTHVRSHRNAVPQRCVASPICYPTFRVEGIFMSQVN